MVRLIIDRDSSDMTDDQLVDRFLAISCTFTPSTQDAPCSNCAELRAAVKVDDMASFKLHTNFYENLVHDDLEELEKSTKELFEDCKHCIWYYVDAVFIDGEEEFDLT